MIRNIRTLHLVRALGSHANADAMELLLRVIERTNFAILPEHWVRGCDGRWLAPGGCGRGADHLFYNSHNERAMSADDAPYLVRIPRACLLAGHSVCWDEEALAAFERKLDGEVGVGTGVHDRVIGWDGDVPVERNSAMSDSSTGPSSRLDGGSDADGRRRAFAPSTSTVVARDNVGCPRARVATDLIVPRTNIGVCLDGSLQASRGQAQANGNYFRLMFVPIFLAEVGSEEIPASVLEGLYYQLIGYVRRRIDS